MTGKWELEHIKNLHLLEHPNTQKICEPQPGGVNIYIFSFYHHFGSHLFYLIIIVYHLHLAKQSTSKRTNQNENHDF